MNFFIASSYKHKDELSPRINVIKDLLKSEGHRFMVFTEQQHNFKDSRDMMEASIGEIRRSDVLIAEMSYKKVGVGIEMGAAYVLDIPIIGVRLTGSNPSTTMEGVLSIPIIEYKTEPDLRKKLIQALSDERFTGIEGRLGSKERK